IELVFLQKAMKLAVQVTTNAEKKTDVQVQSWVVGQAVAPTEKTKTEVPRTKGSLVRPTGPRPKDLPLPDDAEDVEFTENTKTVRFKSPSSIPELVDYYRDELKKSGWLEDQKKRIIVVK